MPRFSAGSWARNPSMAFSSSLRSISCSTGSASDTSSASSSRTAGAVPPPRLPAVLYLYRLRDTFLVSFPRKADRMLGRWGGMAFHACI